MTIPDSASEATAAAGATAAIDAWRDRRIVAEQAISPVMSPLHRGVSNACWRVKVDNESFFMKIAHDDLVEPVHTGGSFRAASAVAAAGLTPKARFLIEAQGVTVFDWLGDGWRTAHLDDLAAPDTLQKLLAAKKSIHALAPFERDSDVFARIEHLARGIVLSAELQGLLASAASMAQALHASGIDRRPCHADGVTSNVMLHDDGALQLVDFDEAANTDPAFDLAVTLNEILVADEEWPAAVELADGHFTQALLARYRCYAFADDLRWGLWALRMDATSPRRNIEFMKYAQWRLLRCAMVASRLDVDRLLALI
jgi:thiamine kinase-like enzyme